MTRKFKNKYRVDTVRAKWWDYSNNGSYFVTICAKDRQHFFGEISDAKMELNEIGQIVVREWKRIAEIRPHIFLDEFVVMPNHFHGILIVDHGIDRRDVLPKRIYNGVHKKMSEISPNNNSISTAIRFFKRQTTIHARKINPQFAWQPRFYDVIIKNEKSFHNIRRYIKMNPAKWQRDRNKQKGLFF